MSQTTQLSDADWMREFQRRVTSRRVPLSGVIELTSRCNLKCVHCYLGPQEEQWKKRSLELPTEKWLSLIDEIVAEGCLHLTITGGDPMVHPDFPRIYRHAREHGLLVTVFCDGILVKDRIVELFEEYPPTVVEISLYGATRETYEAVTRVPGSYGHCLKGIRRLLDGGHRVKLKTVLMTINSHEIDAMRAMAEELDVPFRIDNAIFPCLPNDDHSPMSLRVSPEEAVHRELSDPKRVKGWVKHLETHAVPTSEKLYRCGAGVSSFFVDPFGNASPCLLTTAYRHSLEQRSFASLWGDELVQLRSKTAREGFACGSCEMQIACGGCPAFNYQETGEEDRVSEYVCKTTQLRWDAIQSARRTGRPELPAIPTRAETNTMNGWQPIRLESARVVREREA